jgi:hypothetical protein
LAFLEQHTTTAPEREPNKMSITTQKTEIENRTIIPRIAVGPWFTPAAKKVAAEHNDALDKAQDLHTKADQLLADLSTWSDAPPTRRQSAEQKEMIVEIRFRARSIEHAAISAMSARAASIETMRRTVQVKRQLAYDKALQAAIDALTASGGMAVPQQLETTAKAMSGPVEARRSVSEIQAARNQLSLADLSHIESELRALITATLMD